jgi:hypothetical protein
MRFISNGPDVPERLIRAHEEGNVVFFCGAGISYPAGLQSFTWLVDRLYERLHRVRKGPEAVAYQDKRFDAVLTLLEKDLAGGRQTLRAHLPDILKPNLRKRRALDTHRALLALSRDREDKTRLVTTNFDRLFVKADNKVGHISAPHLPTPKRSRWDGVVYLHGLMDEVPSQENLNRLVLTSGDFGLAYLTERWASRFVSELFAKYTVCFTGYSADDPVLRYMLDALSADELLGENPIEVFSFAGAASNAEEHVRESWNAKGVTPIVYEDVDGHAALHETIRSWAATYRDGLQGRRGVALREARLSPDKLDESGSADRLLWALNEPTGEIAKAFAMAEPVPSIDWLSAFTERRFGRADLSAFGIVPSQIPGPGSNEEGDLTFSFLSHPSAPGYARWSNLVTHGDTVLGLDEISFWMAQWLCRHLDKPEPILWVAQSGGRLHRRFEYFIQQALREGKLGDAYRRIWEVVAGGYAKTRDNSSEFQGWAFGLPDGPIGTVSKLALYDLLQPRVSFRQPHRLREENIDISPSGSTARVRDIVDWDIGLEGGHPHDALDRLKVRPDWPSLLVDSLPVFTQLLKLCVELMALLEGATRDEDLSVWHQPSIASHDQNMRFNAWTTLIELCRDAWNATVKANITLALSEFERWCSIDYVVFRRLAMYCAATSEIVPTETALRLLLKHDSLWSENCKHEAIQLLIHVAPKLKRSDAAQLLKRIVKGPPRKLYGPRLSRADWKYIFERTVWIRLTKWRESRAKLPKAYSLLLGQLDDTHPEWLQESSERLEFRSWMSSGSGDWRTVSKLPRDVYVLARALAERKDDFFAADDWSEICAKEPELARRALKELVDIGSWPGSAWRDALNTSEQSTEPVITLTTFGQDIAAAPDAFFVETEHALPWWLRQQAQKVSSQDAGSFINICRRIVDALKELPLDLTDDVVGQAINHPIGRTVEALIQNWYSTKPQAGQGLDEPYRSLLLRICSAEFKSYRPGIVLAAANLYSLYVTDPVWTCSSLLPWFDWELSSELAAICWEGYLWAPRIDEQLFREMSSFFAAAARHYDQLGKHKTQFASLLVWTTMEVADVREAQSLSGALNLLPPSGLADAADTLSQAIAQRKETLDDYLIHRVRRIYPGPWPKSTNSRSVDEAKALALFCVRAGEQFPTWVKESKPFLQPFPELYMVVKELYESGLCAKFPDSALDLLFQVVPDVPYPTNELSECLTEIEKWLPKVTRQKRFQRLSEISNNRI